MLTEWRFIHNKNSIAANQNVLCILFYTRIYKNQLWSKQTKKTDDQPPRDTNKNKQLHFVDTNLFKICFNILYFDGKNDNPARFFVVCNPSASNERDRMGAFNPFCSFIFLTFLNMYSHMFLSIGKSGERIRNANSLRQF